MQLKTALLSTAVVAALAGTTTYLTSSQPTAVVTNNEVIAPSTSASPKTSAQAIAVAQHKAALRALADSGARPGSQQAWASTSPEEADSTAAAERARGLLATTGAREVNLAQADGFAARDVMIDRDGTEHVRMERSYQGLPVIGGDMVVHSRDGQLLSVTQSSNMQTTLRPKLKPGISAAQARTEAGAQFDGNVTRLDAPTLVVYARNGVEPTLAYQVELEGQRNGHQEPGLIAYFVDAGDGRLLQAEDHIHTAAANGTAKTLNLGNVGIVTNSVSGGYELTDVSRGNGQTLDQQNSEYAFMAKALKDTDNAWGNNATSDRATAAVDAHYGVAATWDYYKTVHGRNGIYNDGKGVKSYVHYGNNYFNAFWNKSNKTMNFGDGDSTNSYTPLVALDIAAHEMAHGVNSATANLGYYNIKDSGGVNEASSDIFGALVEFSIGNVKDTGDYMIGESIYPNNDGKKAIRLMFAQSASATPRGLPIDCYPTGGFDARYTGAPDASGKKQKYDPHLTSGVGNRFFYLLAEGAVSPANFPEYTPARLVCNGDTAIVGIGLAKAGAIWYRALTKYFVSSTDYPGARTGTLKAATDLYGANSPEYQAVARSWSAANVN